MKDIKTKECKRAPKLKDPMSRMPKELMRDAVLKAKEKSHDISEAGSSGDSQESPTEYASRKITSAEEQAASVTVRAVSGAGRVMAKKSFEKIKSDIYDTGEIQIKIDCIYKKDEINYLNNEIDRLIKELITNSKENKKDDEKEETNEDYDKIKIIHDFIINTTKYDIDNNKDTKSYNAYGALKNHLATCNGYTDLMAIFLSKMGYENFKIATTNETTGHVWNVVKINNEWLHLDLTWDDPVSSDGKDYLYHKYFLINTEGLIKADENITSKEHDFNRAIYSELKTSKQEETNN